MIELEKFNQDEFDRKVEIALIKELLEEYNSLCVDNDGFDMHKSIESIKNSSLIQLQDYTNKIADLLANKRVSIDFDKIIEEAKIYGIDYVKEKYFKDILNEGDK